MSDDKKEPWLNWLALTTVVLAVCATLSTFKGGSYSTRSVMSQNQASDQWSYFQAKSIKGYMYEMQKDALELQLKGMSGTSRQLVADDFSRKIDSYASKTAKYDEERSKIEQTAKRYEAIRDDAQKHSQTFGIAVIFLQIAILLSSIAALIKQRSVWVLGLVVGLVGVVYFFNGFFVFF